MTREEYLKQATKPTPERYCAYCGKKLERKRYTRKWEDIAIFMKRKYCCRECMQKAQVKQGNNDQDYSSAHHSSRLIISLIENRERKCAVCGTTEGCLDVHHIDGDYTNNTSENLMIVCRSCHMKLHRPKSVCKICGKPMDGGHGYCNKHYLRWKKYGDPLIVHGHRVED